MRKVANIESDMAQRIMLSLLPEVMDPLQRANTLTDQRLWGTDIKTLRSTIEGAKALVINGAKACVGELRHYPEFAESEGESGEEQRYKVWAGKEGIKEEDWRKALIISRDAFADHDNWKSNYGGAAWEKIANVLLDIDKTYTLARKARAIGDWDSELDEMKKLVVSMNVFDGLAHNSGSVMPKLLMEEMGFPSYEKQDREGGASNQWENPKVKEYQKRVERIMDAKELRNPLAVYKEIEPIIQSSSYKHLFKEWINKLRQHSGYRSVEDREPLLKKIRLKKEFTYTIDSIGESMQRAINTINSMYAIGSNQLELYEDTYYKLIDKKVDLLYETQTQLFAALSSMEYLLDHMGLNEMQTPEMLEAAQIFRKHYNQMQERTARWRGVREDRLIEVYTSMNFITKRAMEIIAEAARNFVVAVNQELNQGL